MSEDPEVAMWRQVERAAGRPLIDRALAGQRERIAAGLEALAAKYPEDVFTPDSTQPDGIAGTAMRHAYRTAARLVREHGLPGDEDATDHDTKDQP